MRDEKKKTKKRLTRAPPARESSPRPASAPRSHASDEARPRGEHDFIERIRRRALLNRRPASGGGAPRRARSVETRHPSPVTHHSSLVAGIGDDSAVLRPTGGYDTVVTADLLVEDVDFRLRTAEPEALGHKALAVSLSDIAAMGARPRWALLSIGVPEEVWRGPFLKRFYAGFFRLAAAHGVALVGGDVSRTPGPVVIDSIVLGEVRRGRAVTRDGARAGDQVFVTGTLGGAAAGLRLLENLAHEQPAASPRERAEGSTHKRTEGSTRGRSGSSTREQAEGSARGHAEDAIREWVEGSGRAASRRGLGAAARELIRRQTRPEPRVEWGALLGERRLATAMIDLSDGLSSDLGRLCRESGVGALVEAELLPAHPRLRETSGAGGEARGASGEGHRAGGAAHGANSERRGSQSSPPPPRLKSSPRRATPKSPLLLPPLGEPALALAAHGGEDFELLFTVRPRDAGKLPGTLGGVPVTRIGEIRERRFGLKLLREGRARALRPEGFDHFARR